MDRVGQIWCSNIYYVDVKFACFAILMINAEIVHGYEHDCGKEWGGLDEKYTYL